MNSTLQVIISCALPVVLLGVLGIIRYFVTKAEAKARRKRQEEWDKFDLNNIRIPTGGSCALPPVRNIMPPPKMKPPRKPEAEQKKKVKKKFRLFGRKVQKHGK